MTLGQVRDSARVRLSGEEVGTLICAPFALSISPLRETGNVLEIDVTNVAANRIRDMDRRGEAWRIFQDVNVVDIHYQPFDASHWPVRPSGLLGPVDLVPMTDAAPAEA